MNTHTGQRASFSIFSIVALAAAILSFFSSGGWGFILAIIAMLAGIIGIALAILPGTRGGITSFFAVIAGLIGLGVAIGKLILGA